MKTLTQLNNELRLAKEEYANIQMPYVSQNDIEDISDRYQEALEAGWALDELSDRINKIKEEIILVKSTIHNRPRIISGVHKITATPKTMTRNEIIYNSLPRPTNIHLDACPICGDYEGDQFDCPNGCHEYNIPKEWRDFNPEIDLTEAQRNENNEPSMRGE